jgi:GNAT superfamily N-acetyltransferase
MDISIRKATLADASRLSDLLRRLDLFPAVQAEEPAETVQRLRRYLAQCLGDDSHSVYIAEDRQGALLAYAAAHWLPYLIQKGPEGFISELFVDAGARGQGVGTCLLEVVETEARQRGCARLSLINMRDRESYQRGFYAKQGWQDHPMPQTLSTCYNWSCVKRLRHRKGAMGAEKNLIYFASFAPLRC